MDLVAIISFCILLLLAYVFDISSSKTKIPSVILLLSLGFLVKQVVNIFKFKIPDLNPTLPFLGTIGLVLIVLESSLELELNKSKLYFIWKSFILALLPMLVTSFGLAFAFQYFGGYSFKDSLSNTIPLAIISSAIAIPSSNNLLKSDKTFIVYESSFSDILGVILFNLIITNNNFGFKLVGHFIFEVFFIIVISCGTTLGLAFFLSKIKHHIKFIPMILMILLIYSISKMFHLPALIFILFFGLFLCNIDKFKNYRFINIFNTIAFYKEVRRFKILASEFSFLIRALFFLLFGYLIETNELFNENTIFEALCITAGIFIIRALFLKLLKLPINPLLYIAPRGLISILLFLSIPEVQKIEIANKSLLIQVIILTAMIMMFGLMKCKNNDTKTTENNTADKAI
nr:cation:proton antiporter [uncultured Bacteroides sp.]